MLPTSHAKGVSINQKSADWNCTLYLFNRICDIVVIIACIAVGGLEL